MRPKIRGNRGHVFLHNGRGIVAATWKDGVVCATIAGQYSQEIVKKNGFFGLMVDGKGTRRIFKAIKRCANQDAREKRRRRRSRQERT